MIVSVMILLTPSWYLYLGECTILAICKYQHICLSMWLFSQTSSETSITGYACDLNPEGIDAWIVSCMNCIKTKRYLEIGKQRLFITSVYVREDSRGAKLSSLLRLMQLNGISPTWRFCPYSKLSPFSVSTFDIFWHTNTRIQKKNEFKQCATENSFHRS